MGRVFLVEQTPAPPQAVDQLCKAREGWESSPKCMCLGAQRVCLLKPALLELSWVLGHDMAVITFNKHCITSAKDTWISKGELVET